MNGFPASIRLLILEHASAATSFPRFLSLNSLINSFDRVASVHLILCFLPELSQYFVWDFGAGVASLPQAVLFQQNVGLVLCSDPVGTSGHHF